MAELTITAPATYGATVEITGEPHDSFLIHKSEVGALYGLRDVDLWRVTHIASAARFPFDFATKEAAIGFAESIKGVHDWSAVAVARSNDFEIKSRWVSGAPTKEQTSQIFARALLHGGVRT